MANQLVKSIFRLIPDGGDSTIILIAIFIRWCVALHPHSGQGKPPMFGDYEAQRHWMEITYNLPVDQWYFNSTKNDLMYWGLDYPPLTAYHSWLLGWISSKINPEWVELFGSRGHDSSAHKLFMRFSVFFSDFFIFFPAALFYFSLKKSQFASLTLFLLYPGLILIDYGHFQYNSVSLGFALWAVYFLEKDRNLLGSLMFIFSLNYKQMELYHSLPFFAYLLGKCIVKGSFRMLFSIGFVVVAGFALCWWPFLSDIKQILQVLHRLFPFARGLFEDKVANVWCSTSILIKWHQIFSQKLLIRLCTVSTLLSLLPSNFHLAFFPTMANFRSALINSSLSFFLFSFQVHEKSIILAALPVGLLLPDNPFVAIWFLLTSTFSMVPLFIKDQLLLPAFSLTVVFFLVTKMISFDSKKNEKLSKSISILYHLSLVGMILLLLGSLTISPPPRYPHLWQLLVSIYSCIHFSGFLLYFNVMQLFYSGKEHEE